MKLTFEEKCGSISQFISIEMDVHTQSDLETLQSVFVKLVEQITKTDETVASPEDDAIPNPPEVFGWEEEEKEETKKKPQRYVVIAPAKDGANEVDHFVKHFKKGKIPRYLIWTDDCEEAHVFHGIVEAQEIADKMVDWPASCEGPRPVKYEERFWSSEEEEDEDDDEETPEEYIVVAPNRPHYKGLHHYLGRGIKGSWIWVPKQKDAYKFDSPKEATESIRHVPDPPANCFPPHVREV